MSRPQERNVAADYGLVCAWFAVSLIVIGILGFLVNPARDRLVISSVNAALEKAGEKRRLSAPLSKWGSDGRASLALSRFSLENGRGGASVFTVTGGGAVVACVALVDENGRVERVLPLGTASAAAIERLPDGLLRSFILRIEETERLARNKERK